jgi:aminoglycoside phosphotransferase (APT) family kinase protein
MKRPFLGKLYLGLFLWKIGLGDLQGAQRYLAEAINRFPSIDEHPEELARLITNWALRQPYGPPATMAEAVLDNLPDCAARSERSRRSVRGGIYVAQAFDAYHLGHRAQVRRYVLKGISQDATFLKNRGVSVIFARSCLGLGSTRRRNAPNVLKTVISEVEAHLGSRVDSAERVTWGYSENEVYVIRAGGQPRILRLSRKDCFRERIAVQERVRAAGVPAPAVLASGHISAVDHGLNWLLEEHRPGSFIDPPEMSHAEITDSVADLGRHLRQLHTIRPKGFGEIASTEFDAPYQTFGAWMDNYNESVQVACAIGAISEVMLPALDAADRLLRTSFSGPPALCHGDLTCGNIFFDGGQVTGIVDWEHAGGGDPAHDLAVFLVNTGHFWYPARDGIILTTVLQAYDAEEPDAFYCRVLAHRVLLAAAELAEPMHKDDHEYLDACRYLLEDYRSSMRI